MSDLEEKLRQTLVEKNNDLLERYRELSDDINAIDRVTRLLNKNSVCSDNAQQFLEGYKACLKDERLWLNMKIDISEAH